MGTVLLTGGAGFIGSALIRQLLTHGYRVINLDALTYAGNLDSLSEIADHPAYTFLHGDIRNSALVSAALTKHQPDALIHLAAESHVDRSIHGPLAFVETNVSGTGILLEACRQYWSGLPPERQGRFRFHHVSTDEVFGSLGTTGQFSETTPYQPRSPYAASKAASDHLVRAWHHTYGLPIIISNCSNNYGPRQFPEKLIPLVLLRALQGETLPIYGNGQQIRDWLYVEDHARALQAILERGRTGGTYCVGGEAEMSNLAVVQTLCARLDQLHPRPQGEPYADLIRFVADRPGHDQRYAINPGLLKAELGWRPTESFSSGLDKTLRWYLDHPLWLSRVQDGRYRQWVNHQYQESTTP